MGNAERLYQESEQIYALATDIEHALDGVVRDVSPLVASGAWRGPTADRTTSDLSQNQNRLKDLAQSARLEAYARWQHYCREVENLAPTMPAGPLPPGGISGPSLPGPVPLPCPGPLPHH